MDLLEKSGETQADTFILNTKESGQEREQAEIHDHQDALPLIYHCGLQRPEVRPLITGGHQLHSPRYPIAQCDQL